MKLKNSRLPDPEERVRWFIDAINIAIKTYKTENFFKYYPHF